MSSSSHADPNRRDFLFVATGAAGAVGTALAIWPLINQMNPDASVRAMATVEVDLASIAEGQEIKVLWRGSPVFIRHRTPAEIEAAKAVTMDELKDPLARNANAKASVGADDVNRVVDGKEQFLVMVGVCTHLGCTPQSNQETSAGKFAVEVEGGGRMGGWYCPCHGSQYDTSGRIRSGPAPENLGVPLYSYISDTKILIGEMAKSKSAPKKAEG